MYYSPAPGKCILIEGTGGVARRPDAAGKMRDSLTACNSNLKACTVAKNFERPWEENVASSVDALLEIWGEIRKLLVTPGPPSKKAIRKTITLAAKNYHPNYFVVGKRLGDESQALACLRPLDLPVIYGTPSVIVFVTFDRLALAAALYYRVPAVIFSWDLTTTDRETNETKDSSRITNSDGFGKGGAFIAYRTELDTPKAQITDLLSKIQKNKDNLEEQPSEKELHAILQTIQEKITAAIMDASALLKDWEDGAIEDLHKTRNFAGAYEILLKTVCLVPSIQQ